VDTELELSQNDFKPSIKNYYANKHLSAIDQLKTMPPYPTPHLLAQFASMAFLDCKHADPEPPDGWQLLTTASNCGISNGYFGAAYWHREYQQMVIAHRGTDITNIGADVTDAKGVLSNKYFYQMNSASTFSNKVVAVMQEIEQEKKVCFDLFFTGHSLGGWLAQVTAFTTEYLEVKGGTFVRKQKREEHETLSSSTVQQSHYVTHSYHPHTVVFDSPGCKYMLSQMADKLDGGYKGCLVDLQHLDITSYLSAPNIINTCNTHLGTIYRIFVELSDMGLKEKNTHLYNLATHSMDRIKQAFDPETGQVRKDDNGRLKIQEVVDWPVSAGLRYGAELVDFFEWAEHLNNYHLEVKDISHSKVPEGYRPLRYQTKVYDECTKRQNIFTKDEWEFLERYRWLRDLPEFFKPGDLFSVMNNAKAQIRAKEMLQNFKLEQERILCLNALIPYVQRLVRLYPQLKDKAKHQFSSVKLVNSVYQYETQLSVTNNIKSALDFKAMDLRLREFLDSDKQIWKLRITNGDAWTGIKKVYRVVQKGSFMHNYSSEGNYTIMELERLLAVNGIINSNALLTSIKTPHLLMIACGTNQPDNQVRDMFSELFSTVELKNNMKVILTTQSDTDALIQKIAKETFGLSFITTDEG
jgi:hypothetical protein